LDCPFFGSRRMAVMLEVNRKHIQRLMRILGIQAPLSQTELEPSGARPRDLSVPAARRFDRAEKDWNTGPGVSAIRCVIRHYSIQDLGNSLFVRAGEATDLHIAVIREVKASPGLVASQHPTYRCINSYQIEGKYQPPALAPGKSASRKFSAKRTAKINSSLL
jgi:hypothetical protein